MLAGALEIEMSANISRLVKDMDLAKRTVGSAMADIERVASAAKTALVSLGAIGIAASFAHSVKAAIDLADEMNKLSQRTGVATEALAQLRFAAKLSDVSSTELSTGLKKLNVAISEGLAGDKAKVEAFKNLGITLRDTNGQVKSADQVLLGIADAFAGAKDGATKTAYAVALLGKAGDQMIPLLNGGGAAIREMMDKADRLGLTISKDFAGRAEEFNDNLQLLSVSGDRLAVTMGDTLVKALAGAAKAMADASVDGGKLKGLKAGLDRLGEDLFGWTSNAQRKTIDGLRADIKQLEASLNGPVVDLFGQMDKVRDQLIVKKNQLAEVLNSYYRATSSAGAGRGSVNPQLLGPVDSIEKQAKELKALSGGATAVESEFKKLVDRIGDMAAANEAALDQQEKMTAGQKLAAQIAAQLERGTLKLTDAEVQALDVLLQRVVRAEQALDLRERETKATLDAAEAQARYTQQLSVDVGKAEAAVAAQRQQNMEIGLTKEAIDMLTAARHDEAAALIEQQAIRAFDKNLNEAEYGEKLRLAKAERDLGAAIREGAAGRAAYEQQQQRVTDFRSVWESIDHTAHDVWTNIWEGGSNVFKKLGQVLKASLLDLLYQMTVRRWVISIAASMTGAAPSIVSAATGGLGGGAGGLGGLGSLLGGAGALGTFGGGLSAGFGGLMGSVGSMFGAAGTGTTLMGAVDAGVMALQAGNIAGGLGTLAGALGPIALGIMAIVAIMGKSHGPKFGGSAGDYTGTLGLGNNDAGVSGAAGSTVAGMQAQLDAFSKALGVATGQIRFGLGIVTDPNGKSPSFVDFTANNQNGQIARFLDTNVGRSQEELQTALTQMAAKTMLSAMQTLVQQTPDVPDAVRTLIASANPNSASAADVQAVVGQVQAMLAAISAFDAGLGSLPFAQLTNLTADLKLAMLEAGGGVQQFTQNVAGYLQNFFSEEERRAITAGNIAKTLQGVGLGYQQSDILAMSRDQFRALVESIDTSTDSGARLYATFMNVQEAFASITPLAEEGGEAVLTLAEALDKMRNPLRTVEDIARNIVDLERQSKGLGVELLMAQGDTAGARALQKALDTQGWTDAEIAIYDYNQGIRDQITKLQEAKAASDAATAAQKRWYDNFTSPSQKRRDTATDIASQISALGYNVDADFVLASTRKDAARYMEYFKSLGEAGQPMVDLLIRLGDAFASITEPITEATTAVVDYAALQKAWTENFTTSEEKRLATAQAIADKVNPLFASIGMNFSATDILGMTRDEIADGMEKLKASGPAGEALIKALLEVGPELASITQWAEEAAPALRDVAANIANLNAQTSSLQAQLLEVQGNHAGALALQKALDTAGWTDAEIAIYDTNVALREQIATEQALNAKAQQVASTRAGLEKQILEAQGNTTALRALELASLQALDPTLVTLQQQLWGIQDAAAAEAAAEQHRQQVAAERLSLQQQVWQLEGNTAALRASELAKVDASNRALQQRIFKLQDEAKAAEKAAAIAAEREGLQKTLWGLQGNTAALRALELSKLDPANRALQQQIWALQDQAAAADEATRAAEALKSAWQNIADSLFEEARRARGLLTPQSREGLAQLQSQFAILNAQARAGSQGAAGQLVGVNQSILTLAQSQLSTLDFKRLAASQAFQLDQTGLTLSGQYGLASDTPTVNELTKLNARIESVESSLESTNTVLQQIATNTAGTKTNTGEAKATLKEIKDRGTYVSNVPGQSLRVTT